MTKIDVIVSADGREQLYVDGQRQGGFHEGAIPMEYLADALGLEVRYTDMDLEINSLGEPEFPEEL